MITHEHITGEADSSNGSGANIAAPNDGPDEMNGDTCEFISAMINDADCFS